MTLLRSLGLAVFFLVACEPHDLGRPCPPPEGSEDTVEDASPDDTEIVFPATVRKDGKCESFQCVSTQVRSNYCSRECQNQGDCPEGFLCGTLQPVGPLSQEQFCLLAKPCRENVSGDCPRESMVCRSVPTTVPDQPAFFCDVKE